jgi:hypothetical protein
MSLCRWMKKFEQKLLNHLQEDTISNDVPLKNVKEGLGSIAYVTGNPKTKTEITINIDTFFYTTAVVPGGVAVAPAALPVGMQTTLSVYLFGLTDWHGGYLRLRNLVQPGGGWQFNDNLSGIVGFNYVPAIAFLQGIAQSGDMFLSFSIINPLPALFGVVRIRCQNVAYGTFLNAFVSDLITIDTIRYIVPVANINQLINPVVFGVQSLFGKVKADNIDPRMYITNRDFQQQIADIPINLPIDKSLMIGFSVDVFCQNISWVLFVNKVESLTHR